MDIALVADGLVKRFGEKTAVNHLHLAVPRGSWFGVVGPNGAGKTTSIRMMVGLLRPNEGTVLVNGVAVWPDPTEVKRMVAFCPTISDCSSDLPAKSSWFMLAYCADWIERRC